MLWIGTKLLPQDGSGKVSTTAPYNFVNQLNTARRFMWNRTTKAKCLWKSITNLPLEVFEMVVSVGIDVAKDMHDCFIRVRRGKFWRMCLQSPTA